ncbi:TPA: hypothetical protein U9I82_003331 [Acinetobacter baumannii]|nr:hypothetical protein [Acinetobacter baumannii]EKX1116177.1 hypothetical protein [Acinetobacter baumannii]EKX7787157.1 hypothetical protein [Acinetobacter baumannii]HEN9524881.1 hypothetical protein [Acinetobacter baumannii]HEO0817579.1 hypothetical protein [Acinetobacter baumannii]
MTDLNKEREAFLNTFQYYKGRRDIIFSHEHELFMTRSNNPSEIAQKEISNMNSRWDAWLRCAKHRDAELEKAKAQAVPETHLLIPKEPNRKTIMAMACVCLGSVGSGPEFLTLKEAKDVYSALVEKESGAEG